MLDWIEIRIAEAQRDYLVEQAAASHKLAQRLDVRGRIQSAATWLTHQLGDWLVSVGMRLQSRSTEMAESLQRVRSSSVNATINQAEQNC